MPGMCRGTYINRSPGTGVPLRELLKSFFTASDAIRPILAFDYEYPAPAHRHEGNIAGDLI